MNIDINKLFGQRFQVKTYCGVNIEVVVHGNYMCHEDINQMFQGSTAIHDGRGRLVEEQVHLYPWNPSVCNRAKENGYHLVELRKLGRELEHFPSLVAFSHCELDEEGDTASVLVDDLDAFCDKALGGALWAEGVWNF